MIFAGHVSRQLVEYADRLLDEAQRLHVEAHLAQCARCRGELDDIRFTAGLMRRLAVAPAPASVWASIEGELDVRSVRLQADPPVREVRLKADTTYRWAFAPAIALVLAIAAGTLWYARRGETWQVQGPDAGTSRMAAGSWIETTASSRARISVGDIGTVDVEPDSRVRLGAVREGAYRIELAQGTISAEINAPPRLFFVETPTSTVVDLGCAYTMHVDPGGGGELRVTKGWASLEWNGRESLVPAGARGRTRPGADPGTPSFEDAPARLQAAVEAFDFDRGGTPALEIVLAESRVRDTLTLWHLLSRVEPDHRARVFDRIAALTPPPPTVSREKALQLDPETLKHWRQELAWSW
jgi:hypothetical protein